MSKLYSFLSYFFLIIGICAGAYVGGYLMLIKPIVECLAAYDANILTGSMIGITIVKCFFSGFVGSIILSIGYFIALVFAYVKN